MNGLLPHRSPFSSTHLPVDKALRTVKMAAIASNVNVEENGASVLLSEPAGDEPFIVERTGVSNDKFLSKSTKFTVKGHNFRRQFSHLYFKRLEALQPRVSQQTKNKISSSKIC